MIVLCIDVGNTRTHAGLMRDGELLWHCDVLTPSAADEKIGLLPHFKELACGKNKPEALSFCSVVPRATEALLPPLTATGWPLFHLTWDKCDALGLPLDYPRPAEIGQDRLALALGALACYGAPVIAVDFGTAVTFDVINSQGAYEGGIIAPGLALMSQYLHEKTAQLPQLDLSGASETPGIGHSTIEAITIGCTVGFAGMIRALLKGIVAEFERRGESGVKTVATGGSLEMLSPHWLPELPRHPSLVLRGLEEACVRYHRLQTKI